MGDKFKVEMIGWECHIQVKNLSSFEVDNATDVINDVAALEETYFFGENDFESCALDNSGNSPLSINVYDAENNLILEMQGYEVSHYSEKDELASKEWDVDIDINPEYSKHYENAMCLEKHYRGSVVNFDIKSSEFPKKEDFCLAYLCISTPKGDIDLVEGLIFRSEMLVGELESGSQKGTYMTVFTSGGDSLEIEG